MHKTRAESEREKRRERQPWPGPGTDSFLKDYGSFMALWCTFDLLVEIIIMRELRLEPQETSIICAGLGFGAKANILYSLLSRNDANADGITLIKRAQTVAERNSFAHGFLMYDGDLDTFKIIKREVKDTYQPKAKNLTNGGMSDHRGQFSRAVEAVSECFKITTDELNDYAEAIAADASARASQDKPHPQSQTNSSKAKRKSRAQPQG